MMKEIVPDRVAIYIRRSTEDHGEGPTLAEQMDGCRHYLAQRLCLAALTADVTRARESAQA